jgi:two-component system, NtrC family, response regulator HydG
MSRALSEKRAMVDYIKPVSHGHVMTLVEPARPLAQVRTLHPARDDENETFGLIGNSPKMQQVYETIRLTAQSDAPVLIEGESGTGKELIARAYHQQSDRASGPFISINCAAIPENLIESELLGYKKGAFTGADRDKRGLIEAASGGTLHLDEIAEMPLHLQTKLLRVLQDRKLRRLGDEQETEVDFRLISATNRETAQAVREGALREDLYFRISTIKIKVPPLRERLDDLALLAERFLLRYSEKYGKPIRSISQAAFTLLSHHDWPGNVRELESVIERAVLFCHGEELQPAHLPEHLQDFRKQASRCVIPPFFTLEEIERDAIEQTLERTGGNIKKTAEILHLHRPTLYRKLKRLKMKGNGPASE